MSGDAGDVAMFMLGVGLIALFMGLTSSWLGIVMQIGSIVIGILCLAVVAIIAGAQSGSSGSA